MYSSKLNNKFENSYYYQVNMKKTLEKIINKTKDFVKKNAKIGVMLGSLAFGSVVYGSASPGYSTLKNCLNSEYRHVNINRDDGNFFGAKDGIDDYDKWAIGQPSGFPNCYSDINDNGTVYHLWSDYRAEDSNIPYDIKLSFNGTLTENKPNWLEFEFSCGEDYEFADKPITFQSDRLPYGDVVDVRRAIAQNNGRVDLIDVPAGPYNQWVPYGSGRLDIGSRILSDLNDNGIVNFEDFALLANDWMKTQGQYIGDICGPNGIPDGYVNGYDLSAFGDDWLKDVNDPNTW